MATTSILNSVLAATNNNSGSGIDVAGAVNAILYADRAPERAWQAQQATLSNEASAIQKLESESSSLADDLNALQDPNGALSSVSVTSSNSTSVSASAVPGTATGTHQVSVTQLATTASVYSNSEATSSTALPSGSFTIQTGSASTTITTGSGVNTLDELAASINGQSLGVTASVVTDTSGARLAIVSNSAGSSGNFTVSSSGGLTFTQPVTGADASLTVDGVPVTSASNTVTGVLSGVTLNLQSAGTATLTLSPDASSIQTAVSTFVTDYNTLITDVNSQFAYNSLTQTAGTLASDSVAQGLQQTLGAAANYGSGSGTYQTLSSLGISTNPDGTLSLDSTALSNAVQNNFSAVTSFFQGSASNGFAASLNAGLSTYTDPSSGAFTVDLSSLKSENTDLTNQTNTLELYLTSEQTRLTTEYNNADIALQELPQQLKQINALLNPSSSTGTNG